MKEYIEREAALAGIRNLYPGIPFVKALRQRWHEDNKAYMMCENAVETIPAADVVEVKHGENIGEDYDAVDQFVCSKCGIELQGWYRVERDMDDGDETHHEYVMRYCPNCGARMDKEAE